MKQIHRRKFIYWSAAFFASALPAHALWPFSPGKPDGAGSENIRGRIFKNDGPTSLTSFSKECFLYRKLKDNYVVCGICPHRCVLSPGDRSICRAKANINGKLYSLTYGNPCAVHVDPIEKKPLYHFKPQTLVFSLACAGCNFRCLNCQNWEISQSKPDEIRHYSMPPEKAVESAKQSKSKSIAYTYSEAITFYEYMMDIGLISQSEGIYNLLISNGYINREPLIKLCEILDGANINLKSFSDEIYQKLNGGRLQPVLNTLKLLHENDVHLEITNLVVPGYVDNKEMLKKMCGWILENIGPDHPLHFLRFFPKYKLDRIQATPLSTLTEFRKLAMEEGIRYVYIGNVPGHEGNHTHCHECKKLVVRRMGYQIDTSGISGNQCKYCQTIIPGIW